MKRTLFTSFLGLGLGFAVSAHAVPITYNATLQNGVPVTGAISPTNTVSNPVGAQYYRFFANAGDTVSVIGDRLDGDFDMSFWILTGVFADTNAFGGSFDTGDASQVLLGDDEDAANIAGPFGDPNVSFTAGTTGFYTVAVTNFASGPNAGANQLFDFQLVARGIQNVPEPASLALLGIGLAGLGAMRRKKS